MVKNKVLVEVLVPASGEKFDVFIPLTIRMGEAVQLVSRAISDLTVGKYRAADNAIICNAETGLAYDVNPMVSDLGIRNGTRLLLI